MSGHEPVQSAIELATVAMLDDIDHPMPDAPGLTSVAEGELGGVEQAEDLDEAMPDAPELVFDAASVPDGPEPDDDVVMEDAPSLTPDEE